jgi:hypothetical protein
MHPRRRSSALDRFRLVTGSSSKTTDEEWKAFQEALADT